LFVIYISGIDGCGKTTQAKLLNEFLLKENYDSQYQWLRWSPSIGKFISIAKSLIKSSKSKTPANKTDKADDQEIKHSENQHFGKWSQLKNQLFSMPLFHFFWDKYSLWDYYRAYQQNSCQWNSDIIILDRYLMDFFVDQSINHNESIEQYQNRLNANTLKKFAKPDIFILIDIPPETGWERKRDGTSMKHLDRLSKVYNEVKNQENVVTIQGQQSTEAIQEEIKTVVLNELRKRK